MSFVLRFTHHNNTEPLIQIEIEEEQKGCNTLQSLNKNPKDILSEKKYDQKAIPKQRKTCAKI